MAGQIEYVIRMMEVLQDIVLTDLQSQNTKTSGGSRQGSKQSQGKVWLLLTSRYRAFSLYKTGSGFRYQIFSQLAEKNPN